MPTPSATTQPFRRTRALAMKRPVLLLGLLTALSAGAYVLPGGSIMRRMVGARNELSFSSIKADGSVHFYGAGVKEAGGALGQPTDRPELEADGTVYLRVPDRCRFEAKAAEGNTVASVSSGGRKRVEGAEIPALTEAVQQVCALLADRRSSVQEGREALEEYLRGLGIEPRTTSLARFGGEVVYVLGTQGEGKPQFWVFKDNFRPARLLHKDAKGTQWDVRFQDYSSAATGEMLPRAIEVWRGGERLLRFTALAGDTRAKLADTLF
ncbi:hypothetical protein CYFUS_002097 [Cystobacter fuscus]|uniref:Uncharacterized protein n=2 Tax=Cystobacter fuscus TaxID=43 RepID=A0A250IZL4_9BACT|nr:hypothetical protein CYFUS_002097 [Cystobacter fuscus]